MYSAPKTSVRLASPLFSERKPATKEPASTSTQHPRCLHHALHLLHVFCMFCMFCMSCIICIISCIWLMRDVWPMAAIPTRLLVFCAFPVGPLAGSSGCRFGRFFGGTQLCFQVLDLRILLLDLLLEFFDLACGGHAHARTRAHMGVCVCACAQFLRPKSGGTARSTAAPAEDRPTAARLPCNTRNRAAWTTGRTRDTTGGGRAVG